MKDIVSVWDRRFEVPRTSRSLRQRGGARKSALAICCHDRPPRSPTVGGISSPAAVLLDETGSAEVVHLVAHRLVDLSAELATVGSRDAAFPLSHGRGDQVTHAGGGLDPRELPPKGLRTRDIYVPDLHIDIIKAKSRNFH
jgi:hypothetical protein